MKSVSSIHNSGNINQFNNPIKPFELNLTNYSDINRVNSDPFSTTHDGKHILFMGCSVTWGDGLERIETWPWKVYSEISKKEKVSGYYNIAFPGHSILSQVSIFFRYVEKYGKPDVIFFNIPSTARYFGTTRIPYRLIKNKVVRNGQIMISATNIELETKYPGSLLLAEHINFEAYLSLHRYCQEANIKLISFTWSTSLGSDGGFAIDLFKDKFNTFYTIEQSEEDFIFDYIENDKTNSPYLILASDNAHPGIAPHAYYAKIAMHGYNSQNCSS